MDVSQESSHKPGIIYLPDAQTTLVMKNCDAGSIEHSSSVAPFLRQPLHTKIIYHIRIFLSCGMLKISGGAADVEMMHLSCDIRYLGLPKSNYIVV